MKSFSSIFVAQLLLLVLPSTLSIKGSETLKDTNELAQPHPKVRGVQGRTLKKNSGGKNNGKNNGKNSGRMDFGIGYGQDSGNGRVVNEMYPCIPFENPNVQAKLASEQFRDMHDQECTTNSCSNGCCRDYNWLVCDQGNGLPFMRCICNEFTDMNFQVTSPPQAIIIIPSTPAPQLPPPTNQPTQPPSSPPTQATATTPPTQPPTNAPVSVTPAPQQPVATSPPTNPTTSPPTNPTTSPPTSPATSPPTNQPVSPPPTEGTFADNGADECEDGSYFHDVIGDVTAACFRDECPNSAHCCLKTFCICGRPQNRQSDCVPPYILENNS